MTEPAGAAPALPRTAHAVLAASAEAAGHHGVDAQVAAYIAACVLRRSGRPALAAFVEEAAGLDVDPWTWPPARPAVPDAVTARLRRTTIQASASQQPATYTGDLAVLAVAADVAAGQMDAAMGADVVDLDRVGAWVGGDTGP